MHNQKYLPKVVLLILLSFALAACSGTNAGRSGNSVGEVTSVTVTDTVEASGNLSADQLTTLTWGTSGLVEKVNVQVGDKVEKGDILAALSTDSVPASILQAQAELATAQNELDDLKNTTVTYTQAQLDVLAARKEVEEAENAYNGLSYPRASDALIKNTEAKITQQEHKVALATKKYKEYQDHPDGDPLKNAALLDLTNAQMELNELRATLNWYLAKPSEEDYEEAKLNLEKARANLEEARLKRDRVKNGADPADIAAAEAKVAAAQAKVDAMYIVAPFAGEVIAIHSKTNNTVNSGDSAIGLVNRNTMKIDTAIDESSISQISLGDTAQIVMDSLPDTILTGKVTLIDPIGKTVSGLVKYTVTISLDPTDAPVLFGATATVTIVTSEPRTSLAVPISAVQTDTRGEYVIRIKNDSSTERIDIQSGDLAGKLVTIATTSDLKEGDRVRLGNVSTNGSSGNNDRQQQGPDVIPGGPGGGGAPFGGGG